MLNVRSRTMATEALIPRPGSIRSAPWAGAPLSLVKQWRLFSTSCQRGADEPFTILAMSLIRACSPEDMPAVAGLFQKTFLSRRRSAPASLEDYLAELFLHHPWYDPELASRVYVSPEGAVRGFIGVASPPPWFLSRRGAPPPRRQR